MQTFLPYPDFRRSLGCLDNKRLNCQKKEAYQILLCLEKPNRWKNHPAIRQWVNYPEALMTYFNTSIEACLARGFNNTLSSRKIEKPVILPHWLGDDRYHSSHRANLLRKKPEWYGKFGWTEDPGLPYFWPSKEGY